MNAQERIAAAIQLEMADRVPVGPWLDHFAATYAGISKQAFIEDDRQRIAAVLKTMTELGPWDITYAGENVSRTMLLGAPARVRWPGHDLPADEIHQFEEFELLTPEDYDLLINSGLSKFMRSMTKRLHPEVGFLSGLTMLLRFTLRLKKQARMIERAGAVPAAGFLHPGPLFEFFSIGRSMNLMCMDLYDRPERIREAGKIWARSLTPIAIRTARFLKVPRIFIGLSRSSPSMISPAHFEELVLPGLDYMVRSIIDAGMTPIFHCDTNWLRSLHVFLRYPKAKCIIELDGATDIIKAKEILGGHMCLKGDVPAYLLAFASKDEVLAYCKRLIQEVGRGGGFILSSGCSIPANAKPENVRALAEAAFEWGAA